MPKRSFDGDPLYSLRQIARSPLQLHESQLRRWITDGEHGLRLRSIAVDGRVFVAKTWLAAFLRRLDDLRLKWSFGAIDRLPVLGLRSLLKLATLADSDGRVWPEAIELIAKSSSDAIGPSFAEQGFVALERAGFLFRCQAYWQVIHVPFKSLPDIDRLADVCSDKSAKDRPTATGQKLQRLKKRDKTTRCAYCGDDTVLSKRPVIEHMIPTRRGGGNGLSNLVIACDDCNTYKGSRTPLEMYFRCRAVHPAHGELREPPKILPWGTAPPWPWEMPGA